MGWTDDGSGESSGCSAETAATGPLGRRRRRLWQVLSWVLGVGLAVVALLALDSQRGELSGALADLASMRPFWVVVAAAAELGSMLAFAFQQEVLLDAAGRPLRRRWLIGFTFAGNSVNNSFPAGSALATAWAYRQLRRQGATEAVASWELVALVVSSGIGLGLLVAGALVLPGSTSVVPGLAEVAWPFLALTLLAGVAWVRVGDLVAWVRRRRRASSPGDGQRPAGPIRRRLSELAERWLEGIARIRPSVPAIGLMMAWSLLNWGLDAACLALSFVALGARVPWPGLLVAYGAGQLASNLPITPGGIGVVEGSLVIALVAFGGAHDATVAAVLLYRLLSFWLLLPVGWLCWLGLRHGVGTVDGPANGGEPGHARPLRRRRSPIPLRVRQRRPAARAAVVTGSLLGLGLLLGGCAAPRQVLGTPTGTCLRALPAAEHVAGGHGRLLAVHLRPRRALRWLPAGAAAGERSVCVVVLASYRTSSSGPPGRVEVVVETRHWSVVATRSLPPARRSRG